MRKPARPLFLLHRDPLFIERVRTASRPNFILQPVRDWEELVAVIRSAPASAVAIVDPLHETNGRPPDIAGELIALLSLYPSVTVIPALEAGPGSFEIVRRLGAAGVVQIICTDEDTGPIAIRRRVEAARGRPLKHLIGGSLDPSTSGAARAILNATVEVVLDGGGSEQLAKNLFITTRTLLRWSRRAGLPAPRRLLLWVRLLLAAELLDDPGRSISDVALSCGYSSDGGLRNAFRATVDKSPSRLREEGAFEDLSGRFLTALREARTGNVRYRRASTALR
ncbi:MAG TPA: helix-turn-helix domain-containing protein [Longimicrobiaceae bacterium]|nr:helix-turn-helix domain-containing protein [Longimicrobiaceae bacterium]